MCMLLDHGGVECKSDRPTCGMTLQAAVQEKLVAEGAHALHRSIFPNSESGSPSPTCSLSKPPLIGSEAGRCLSRPPPPSWAGPLDVWRRVVLMGGPMAVAIVTAKAHRMHQ